MVKKTALSRANLYLRPPTSVLPGGQNGEANPRAEMGRARSQQLEKMVLIEFSEQRARAAGKQLIKQETSIMEQLECLQHAYQHPSI